MTECGWLTVEATETSPSVIACISQMQPLITTCTHQPMGTATIDDDNRVVPRMTGRFLIGPSLSCIIDRSSGCSIVFRCWQPVRP